MISLASFIPKSVRTAFSYDAVEERGRRKAPTPVLRSEDDELDPSSRRKLVGGNRDLARNFSIAAFMVRKHLDFVASFGFQSKTPDKGFNRDYEWLMKDWMRARNCDVAGRHPFRRLVRIAEARRCLDGDFGLVKLASAKLQGIEGDRIRDQNDVLLYGLQPRRDWRHGVRTDGAGRAVEYAIHRRNGTAFEYERTVKAENLYLHGFFDRIDQFRGISPIASGVNSLRDTYECFDYAIAKAKVSQLFALAIYQESNDATGNYSEDEADSDRVKVDFGHGPAVVNMGSREREGVEVIESKTPSTELQSFLRDCIIVAMKALDLPYSFFNESFTNFFGSRSALLLYLKSAKDKQADVRDMLDDVTAWRLAHFIANRDLKVPRTMDPRDLVWAWIPDGVPWWDPAKEIKADSEAVANGFNSRRRIVQERTGLDFFDLVDEIAEENAYAKEAGVSLGAVAAAVSTIEKEVKDDDDDRP